MRQIKVQAWDIENEVMIGPDVNAEESWFEFDSDGFHLWGTEQYFETGSGESVEYCRPVEIKAKFRQFTGLTDKNGREIYEGDIVKTNKFVTSVTFFEGCFYTVTDGGNYRCGGWNRSAIEVIGNIHQNPELLETS